jgi:hypothetical protein
LPGAPDETEPEPFVRGRSSAPTHTVEAEAPEVEVPFDDFDLVPGYGDEDQLPAYPGGDVDVLVKRRPRRGRKFMVALVALGIIAGGGYYFLRPGIATLPPIITADGTPARIVPAPADPVAPEPGKLIYDRIDTASIAPNAGTTLVPPATEQIADVVPADAAPSDNPISRVIAPGGPAIDQLIGDNQAAAAPLDPNDAIGPRRVRTVVVNPDGTIISSEAAEVADGAPAAVAAAAALPRPEPVEPLMFSAPAVPAPTNNETMAIAGAGAGNDADGVLAITQPGQIGLESELTALDDVPPPPPDPLPAAGPAPATAEPVVVAAAPAPAALDSTIAATADAMLVQVSSQRSEEAARATFRDLQLRYPTILGPYEVNIQKADLGEKGVFYRARVGPFPLADAQRMCEELKSVGGDCILSRG